MSRPPAEQMQDALLVTMRLDVGRQQVLLAGVDLTVLPGQSVFVLGRNGAGKSTLLSTLLGLLRPLRGRVVAAPAIADRSGLGYVPQSVRFQASLPASVREFVHLGLIGMRVDRVEAAARVHSALTTMQLGGLAARPFRALSLGEQRRALVARALARRPQLLVLDEPTANLDRHGALALLHDLEALRQRDGLALLHASHDLHFVPHFATHVALVHAGRVLFGAAAEVLASAQARDALGDRLGGALGGAS